MSMNKSTPQTTARGRRRLLLLVPALLLALAPALAADGDLVAYKAARIVSKAGESVSPGFLLVRSGKVEKVLEADAKLPEGASVVDLKEAVILPGLVNPLSAISQVNYRTGPGRASQSNSSPSDGRKLVGSSGVNLKHEVYRRLGRTGYTTFAVLPNESRGLIGGQASVIRPALGKEKEAKELVLAESVYLMLGFASGKTWYDAGIKYLKKAVDDILKEKAARKKAEEEVEEPHSELLTADQLVVENLELVGRAWRRRSVPLHVLVEPARVRGPVLARSAAARAAAVARAADGHSGQGDVLRDRTKQRGSAKSVGSESPLWPVCEPRSAKLEPPSTSCAPSTLGSPSLRS